MIRRWGRAAFQLICAHCKGTIEDGESIAYLPLGQGVLCAGCGKAEEGK